MFISGIVLWNNKKQSVTIVSNAKAGYDLHNTINNETLQKSLSYIGEFGKTIFGVDTRCFRLSIV